MNMAKTVRFRGKNIAIGPKDYKILMALNKGNGACPASWIRDESTHRRARLDPSLGIELLDVAVQDGKTLYRSAKYFQGCIYVLQAADENRRAKSIVYVNPRHYDIFDDITLSLRKKRDKQKT